MIIQFYVDDLNLSHMDLSVLDNIVRQLNDVFRTSKKELIETKNLYIVI